MKKEEALEIVTFPLTKKRLANMLSEDNKIHCFNFKREPFEVVDDDNWDCWKNIRTEYMKGERGMGKMGKRFNFFAASVFCPYGILGGWIEVEEDRFVYRTTKLVMPLEYKEIQMKYVDIENAEAGWAMILPTIKLEMKDGRNYKFVIFSRKKFINIISKKNGTTGNGNT